MGYPCQTWIPDLPFNTGIKRPVSMEFTKTEKEPSMQQGVVDYVTGVPLNRPNLCIYNMSNGQFFPKGQPITFEGSADAFGSQVSYIEVSMDRGQDLDPLRHHGHHHGEVGLLVLHLDA